MASQVYVGVIRNLLHASLQWSHPTFQSLYMTFLQLTAKWVSRTRGWCFRIGFQFLVAVDHSWSLCQHMYSATTTIKVHKHVYSVCCFLYRGTMFYTFIMWIHIYSNSLFNNEEFDYSSLLVILIKKKLEKPAKFKQLLAFSLPSYSENLSKIRY